MSAPGRRITPALSQNNKAMPGRPTLRT